MYCNVCLSEWEKWDSFLSLLNLRAMMVFCRLPESVASFRNNAHISVSSLSQLRVGRRTTDANSLQSDNNSGTEHTPEPGFVCHQLSMQ